jgi:hypothetical protein
MRQFRAALRTTLYQLLVRLNLPLIWQARFLPKHLFAHQACILPIESIKLYSFSDPSPPKRSPWFCFETSEENKMLPLPSIFKEMTDDNLRSCVHNTVRDLFINNKNYSDTSQHRRMINNLSNGIITYQCKSIEDIKHYFERLTRAFQSIKADGYKSQQELGGSPRDEIRIHITGNGRYCLGSKGNHRLRMAELLEIKQIPCNVYGVNINWLISLCIDTQLPPHKAVLNWLNNPQKIST